ncbi:hypothetical protein KP509_26G022500 [Ceratopteris richardii]|uniref:Two-component response regulator-like APRR1 n=1 Tax=Ceratopteris richardii TaxID=49495 RepID=A0A8T2RJ42_CERRI|nr:hypothetical protein KP509_26G022500 [Ceratopteris richardii]KAH7296409.1 hypothetical protein KP509_26G022500 [Ceratopteris richardii]
MDFSNVHIVFCDHDKETSSTTLALLQKCSYKVTAVRSARDVIETLRLKGADVDIILTDVELPQEKGFKMLRHIVRQEDLGHVAVVVMSDHDDMAVVANCLLLGAADYLVKPLRSNEVMNLWTHMWRKRRMIGLPDKNVVLEGMSFCPSWQKPTTTADLLSGYQNSETSQVTDIHHSACSRDDKLPELELSLMLSLNYATDKSFEQANVATLPSQSSPPRARVSHPSAFSAYPKSCNTQPDEHSGISACSPSSSPSKKTECSEDLPKVNRDLANGVLADHVSNSSHKETSFADEARSGGQTSATNTQGFQLLQTYIRSSPVRMEQSVIGNAQEVSTSGFMNTTFNSLPMLQIPSYCHESGIANVATVPNTYTYYPLPQLTVPVVNFSSWPGVVGSPPLVGGKLVQAERREAALSKFRMKRKGRCFEKKIRYASRKKLAEQRPRIRGQFVKRSALVNSIVTETISDEEGEADDEQGCSELDNNSSADFTEENVRFG